MFRPCIDLHEGKVKQIVGGSLTGQPSDLRVHFVSERPSRWFAELYRRDGLAGGHVIMLGPGNEQSARDALAAYPGGLHVGGGIGLENAAGWLDAGASHVIVTSWIFSGGELDWARLKALAGAIGRNRLVLDLSCRKRGADYFVVTDRWQKFTSLKIEPETLAQLGGWCDEFLIHAADVEGLCRGIDLELVRLLGLWSPRPATYAGGAKALSDLEDVADAGGGKINLTIGSALDIFGGSLVRYDDVVALNRKLAKERESI
ncbi:MAG TPA: phosphoribosylformimino-5-aminoimidazole carboxamide ribotide isomerase [Verrucomicrobiae bacterium]|jgi:phosphoribosylformimino-5-aminoimidazole carboxamide ribotide isomerase